MKVYIAGPYCARGVLVDVAKTLADQGHPSTARWLNATHDIVPGTEGAALDLSDDFAAIHSSEDFADIDEADAVLMFTGEYLHRVQSVRGELHSGGRHVETGYAIARGKFVIVVGEPENIFHRGSCKIAKNFSEAILHLESLNAQLNSVT